MSLSLLFFPDNAGASPAKHLVHLPFLLQFILSNFFLLFFYFTLSRQSFCFFLSFNTSLLLFCSFAGGLLSLALFLLILTFLILWHLFIRHLFNFLVNFLEFLHAAWSRSLQHFWLVFLFLLIHFLWRCLLLYNWFRLRRLNFFCWLFLLNYYFLFGSSLLSNCYLLCLILLWLLLLLFIWLFRFHILFLLGCLNCFEIVHLVAVLSLSLNRGFTTTPATFLLLLCTLRGQMLELFGQTERIRIKSLWPNDIWAEHIGN